MTTHFLYCIDLPSPSEKVSTASVIGGWLLCSHKIVNVKIIGPQAPYCKLEFGVERPDVHTHFKKFSDSLLCGFNILAINTPINLKNQLALSIEVLAEENINKAVSFSLDFEKPGIRLVEIDDNKGLSDKQYDAIEHSFIETLKKNPWLTIRMDITNKCNLKCIMCHYKEKEIYSKPAKNMTADQLKHKIKDIAPFVKNIMLSCGYEPLMSKYFYDIIIMLEADFPHMEKAFCTNAMLLDEKARKTILEHNVTHIIFSLDGVTRETVEHIRVGADYSKIVSHIKALHLLKKKYHRKFPVMYMDFVLMKSNIHEAVPFVQMCAEMGIDTIDFRHLVGNVFFSLHDEMLTQHQPLFNYYRPLIIEASKVYGINVRLPEPFETDELFLPLHENMPDLSDFFLIKPDEQTELIEKNKDPVLISASEADFLFLSQTNCVRPFNEIMLTVDDNVMPCAYYSTPLGNVSGDETLSSIFFGEDFKKLRKRKFFNSFDHNCMHCPIMENLLPTKVV